jgi:hypothetical protein
MVCGVGDAGTAAGILVEAGNAVDSGGVSTTNGTGCGTTFEGAAVGATGAGAAGL